MKTTSKFQIIVLALFIISILAGVALFATYKGSNKDDALPSITIWGTFPEDTFTTLIQQVNANRANSILIDYVEISAQSFDKTFIEALARGQGPDAILIRQDMLLRHFDKVTPIPFESLSLRDFKNTYIPQAELYIVPKGTLALPFSIDPLVMYWNRDIFTNAGIATYPVYWDEFSALAKKINQKDTNSNIRRSVIALGEYSNVSHAREILSTLIFQAGNPITRIGSDGLESTLGEGSFSGTALTTKALNFYTQFSNPALPEYSWNRSLPLSKNWFLSGSLATYIGFASEIFDLRSKNSNLNFDVAPLPQARQGSNRITYGSMYGLSIVRSTPNPSVVYTILKAITSPEALNVLNKASYLPPVRRDMLVGDSTDPYQSIFYDSALISRGWFDMNISKTNGIFQNLVESVTSGRSDVYSAIQTAHQELNIELSNP